MNETTRHTLSVLVENTAGVLSQVSRLFSRKGYNIDSLAVGTTDDPKISRITIEIDTDDASARQIANQLRKLFPVYSVQELSPDDSIRRELVMIKVRAANSEDLNEVIQIANIFRASIIDVSLNSLTIAIIGAESKVDAIQKLLQGFGILEMVRTGMVALERGGSTINDNNKELRPEIPQGEEDRCHWLWFSGPCPCPEPARQRLRCNHWPASRQILGESRQGRF